ncbi:hypothetical protein [Carnimonas bestiolae]|uniref:hypothetical protein n=1 Tax=Carnimonas bestiolae TaxID=3402172 RepID=UPI003EDC8F84
MTIKRAARPDSNFYLLDKDISEDKRLSWGARGMLVFLLGKPDNWSISISHLIKETQGSSRKSGRDAVYSILGELEDAGYLRRSRGRGEKGEFGKTDYTISETPYTENPDVVDSPDTDQPDTDYPHTANPPLTSIEGLTSTEELTSTENNKTAPEANAPVAGSNVVEFQSAKPRVDIPDDMPGPKAESAKTYRSWANYAMCYRNRYSVWPLWNAKVAGQFSNLVDRVGADLAPAVAAYYVRSNNQFYVTKGHAVGPMLNDCESLATQARTGQGMTASKARQLDSTQTNADAAAETKRLLAMDAEAEGWQ